MVNYASLRSSQHAYPWASVQMGRLQHALELWQGVDWVAEGMEDPPPGAEGAVPGASRRAVPRASREASQLHRGGLQSYRSSAPTACLP